MRNLFSIIIFILLLGSVIGCSERTDSILADSACQAPCWRGIHIGATKEEVIDNLKKMADIESESWTIEKTSRNYVEEVIHWRFKGNERFGNIALDDGKVTQMAFILGKGLPISNLITIYGAPESVLVQKQKLDGVFLSVFLFYPQKGICLDVRPSTIPFDPRTYRINPSTKIAIVYYVDHGIEDWETKVGCYAGADITDYHKLIQKWTGFGKYEVYELGANK